MKNNTQGRVWRKFKTISALAAAAVMVTGTMTACAPASDNSADASEITVFMIPSPTMDAIESRIPEFEEETGIKVNVVDAPYGDAHQKMLLSFQSKKGAYDVVQFDNPYLAPFASQNALAGLDDYINSSESYDIGDFVKPLQEYGQVDGVTYGLNLSTEPLILWYRTDIYEKLGLSVPTTWEEYLSNAKTIQDSGLAAGQIIANSSDVNSWWWLQLAWSFGGDPVGADGSVDVTSESVVAATDYMKELLAVSPESALTATGDDATTLFTTQDVGQMINYSGYYPVIADPVNSPNAANIGTAVIPIGAKDITELTGWNIGIPSDSKKKDAAWKFLDFMLNKENTPKLMEAGAAAIGRTSIVDNPAITEKWPYVALLGPAAESGRRLPALVDWAQVSNQIGVAVQNILSGSVSTKDGLDALQDELSATLK
jgi:multiple sugar transport system substrate-binding protein